MKRPPTEDGPLGTYVKEMMPDLYGAFWMRRRVAEEVTGHLRDAVERLQARGLSQKAAEAKAISDFGPPNVVARAFAQTKGIGVTTHFTRWSGIALIVGVTAMAVAFVWSAISVAFEHTVFGPLVISGLTFVGIGLAGIYVRLRGQLGRTARVGVRMLYLGVPGMLICSSMWFREGALVFLGTWVTGFAIYLFAMTRSEILPRAALRLLWLGIAGVAVWTVGNVFSLELAPPALAGQVLLWAGLVWIGAFLWTETPEPNRFDVPATFA